MSSSGVRSGGSNEVSAAVLAHQVEILRSNKAGKLRLRRAGLDTHFTALQDSLTQDQPPVDVVATRVRRRQQRWLVQLPRATLDPIPRTPPPSNTHTHTHTHTSHTLKAAGLKHIGFGPFKRENQDEFFIQVGDFGGVPGGNLFCVFDGHGSHGKDAALASRQLLPCLLDAELRQYFTVRVCSGRAGGGRGARGLARDAWGVWGRRAHATAQASHMARVLRACSHAARDARHGAWPAGRC
jgi:hypothetical protein